MEIFLTVLRYAAGPLIGALIGYLTNWLAVKMLFRPYYPKKLGKWKLPFTPGIIPKRQPALAKAVGKAVGEQLFTKEDLTSAVVSESAKERVADYAVELLKNTEGRTAEEVLNNLVPQDKSELLKERAESFISEKIYSAVSELNLGEVVAREGVKAVNEKKASLGMLAIFLSDGLVSSIAEKLAEGVNDYVEENGRRVISAAVNKELNKVLDAPLSELTQSIDESVIRNTACSLYELAVKSVFSGFAESLDVCAIVEQKINGMDVKELEKLVLSVMKKELNAIVNIGALIGFILGVIMIFI